ncbi:MAG: phage holin family protein, partial [Chloroflexota bacterium]|nr:phage holin family protein [Chloroflexota bacterium]
MHRIAAVWRDEYDTLVNWPRGRRHLIQRGLAVLIVDIIALLMVSQFMDGIRFTGNIWENIIAAALLTIVAGLVTFLVRPVVFIALGINSVIVTGILTVLFMGLTLLIAARVVPGIAIDGFLVAFFASILIAAVNTVLTTIIGLDEDESFYRHSLKRMARSSGDTDDRPGPGFVILQIDGLAEPVLRNALRTGYMPFLSGWLRDGNHRLGKWEALAPSMTSAGQTGILHGNTAGIPAFRWWEKERNYLMVSNHPEDAFEIERRASGPNDLLKDGGTSISNLVSGGATRAIATNSQLAKEGQGLQMSSFSMFLANPYNLTRGAALFVTSIIVEYFQARRQRVRDIQPRISRGMPFPVLKASTTTIMRDMVVDLLIGEMGRGTPIMYADYLGYDEVAHHAGPERPESMAQLDSVDRMMRSLSRAAEDAPRKYHFILVSDHGQTQGAPFEDRYGIGLEELVRSLMEGDVSSLDASNDVEGWGPINTFLTEASRAPGASGKVVARAMRGQSADGVVGLGDTDAVHKGADVTTSAEDEDEIPDLVVAASGNLANIYFTQIRERVSMEGIAKMHPDLLPGLVRHKGIGFIMVRSEEHGLLAIGAEGVHSIDTGEIEGTDPLEYFGEHVVMNLKELDSFKHIGDIFVISVYDPSTGEVAPFEHQVGSHGGLGGNQTKAFVMYPTAFATQDKTVDLVGAPEVNRKIHEWVARAKELDAAGTSPEEASIEEEAELPSVLRTD